MTIDVERLARALQSSRPDIKEWVTMEEVADSVQAAEGADTEAAHDTNDAAAWRRRAAAERLAAEYGTPASPETALTGEDYLWERMRELLNSLGIAGPNIRHEEQVEPDPKWDRDERAVWEMTKDQMWCVCGREWPCEARQLAGLVDLAEEYARAALAPKEADHG